MDSSSAQAQIAASRQSAADTRRRNQARGSIGDRHAENTATEAHHGRNVHREINWVAAKVGSTRLSGEIVAVAYDDSRCYEDEESERNQTLGASARAFPIFE